MEAGDRLGKLSGTDAGRDPKTNSAAAANEQRERPHAGCSGARGEL